MARAEKHYVCRDCGYETQKWYGKCPDCGNWNSFDEVIVEPNRKSSNPFSSSASSVSSAPTKLSEVKSVSENRVSTGFKEFDRVLGSSGTGSGIVPGSVVLLSGDPGVGKSTLLLQIALNLSSSQKTRMHSDQKAKDVRHAELSESSDHKVLYITGEESENQVKLRAERIVSSKQIDASNLYIISTTNVEHALAHIENIKPDLVIVDSIQTMVSDQFAGFPGSLPQIRYATSRLIASAKNNQIPIFLVGHVTKEGVVAGPMILSHMVDVVLFLEGEQLTGTRVLRSFKNRFGDVSEVGIFTMEEKGLANLSDVSSFFMNKEHSGVPGSCLTVIQEGSRPILVEIQALLVPTTMAFARRVASGVDAKRLELLLAVLQKHVKIPTDRFDVFINVVGGLKITETALRDARLAAPYPGRYPDTLREVLPYAISLAALRFSDQWTRLE
jgi:DNA repair protein RadA/Sms